MAILRGVPLLMSLVAITLIPELTRGCRVCRLIK